MSSTLPYDDARPGRAACAGLEVAGSGASPCAASGLASEEVLAQVYDELRRMAGRMLSRERRGRTLQATALVHEAYLRLSGIGETQWESRAHFLGAAARAIRRILIDSARTRHRDRRGGGRRPLELQAAERIGAPQPGLDVLALDDALERLSVLDAQKAKVVELRFFGGLSTEEIASSLGISPSTVARDWSFARAWLHRELCERES